MLEAASCIEDIIFYCIQLEKNRLFCLEGQALAFCRLVNWTLNEYPILCMTWVVVSYCFVERRWTAFPNSSVVKRDVETTVLMIDSQSSFTLPVRENTFWQLTYLPSWDWRLKWCVKSVWFWGSSCFVRVTLHAGMTGSSRQMPKVLPPR